MSSPLELEFRPLPKWRLAVADLVFYSLFIYANEWQEKNHYFRFLLRFEFEFELSDFFHRTIIHQIWKKFVERPNGNGEKQLQN